MKEVSLKIVYGHAPPFRVYNPVFMYAVFIIAVKFADISVCGIGGGYDFHNEIRGSHAEGSGQFVPVTHDHDVRVDNGKGLFGQDDVKRRGNHFAVFLSLAGIGTKPFRKFRPDGAVYPGSGGQITQLSAEDFCPWIIGKAPVLFKSKDFLLRL